MKPTNSRQTALMRAKRAGHPWPTISRQGNQWIVNENGILSDPMDYWHARAKQAAALDRVAAMFGFSID